MQGKKALWPGAWKGSLEEKEGCPFRTLKDDEDLEEARIRKTSGRETYPSFLTCFCCLPEKYKGHSFKLSFWKFSGCRYTVRPSLCPRSLAGAPILRTLPSTLCPPGKTWPQGHELPQSCWLSSHLGKANSTTLGL